VQQGVFLSDATSRLSPCVKPSSDAPRAFDTPAEVRIARKEETMIIVLVLIVLLLFSVLAALISLDMRVGRISKRLDQIAERRVPGD
jgi:hypothetical protein